MSSMRGASLFTGIGGMDLGLERAGVESILQVERDKFCLSVLERRWPSVRRINDVKVVTGEDVAGADIIHGGFPCQPVADQGERRVQSDVRWLWPEFYRIIKEARPEYVIIENVPGLLKRGGIDVLRDLAKGGYNAEWTTLTARAFGAPSHRERVFFVAYPGGDRRILLEELAGDHRDTWQFSTEAFREWEDWRRWLDETVADGDWDDPEAEVLGVDDGATTRMDRARVKACGNAVVPSMAEYIGRRIFEYENG